jgi:hypothetical protein
MFRIRFAVLAGSALVFATSTAEAQSREIGIPSGYTPPAGLCRVWIDGVPAGRQPAPTRCDVARASAPGNARIIYGANSQVMYDPRYGNVDPRYVAEQRRIAELNREREIVQLERQRAIEQAQIARMERERAMESVRIEQTQRDRAVEQARLARIERERQVQVNRSVSRDDDRRADRRYDR